MIEVEQKFILTERDKSRLLEGATFVAEYILDDYYYDTSEYTLANQDRWLRKRNGSWELKVALDQHGLSVDQYREITDEQEIRKYLGLPVDGEFEPLLKNHGFTIFCQAKSTRQKYRKDPYTIDLDLVEFPNSTYEIGEIELMVEDESHIEEAVKTLTQFATEHGLVVAPTRGKVSEYLRRYLPDLYTALLKKGIIKV